MMGSAPGPQKESYDLSPDSELRFEVTGASSVVLELIAGQAEMFGAEMDKNKKYCFHRGARAAVFTWKGASLELFGEVSAYVSDETPMVIYLNTHAALEQLRKTAETPGPKNRGGRGPRIMIAGPTDVGKSTLCKILCNYAVRQGRSPIFVDLDLGQNSLSIPGTISAIFVRRTSEITGGFDKQRPITFCYGEPSPADNMELYDKLMGNLAQAVNLKMNEDKDAAISGMIINTCGWIADEGYAAIVNAALHFELDIVAVIDQERLYVELQKVLPKFVKIVHLPKSGGVEGRSRERRIKARSSAIHKYFYGTPVDPCFPHSFDVSLDDLTVVQVGTLAVPLECLPVGIEAEDYSSKVLPIPLDERLRNIVCAITKFEQPCAAIASTPVIGFIVFTEIDVAARTATILCPQKDLPPHRVLIATKISFHDDQNIDTV